MCQDANQGQRAERHLRYAALRNHATEVIVRHLLLIPLCCLGALAAGEAKKKTERAFPTGIAPGAFAAKEAAETAKTLAGGRVKLVWMQADLKLTDGKPTTRFSGPFNRASNGRVIMGLDTDEGAYRTLMDDTKAKIINARFTHDGNRVLWGDQTAPGGTTWIINWDGTGKREVCDGTVLCTRFDDAAKQELAYVWRPHIEKVGRDDKVTSAQLWAVPIDHPDQARKLLEKPPLSDWRGFSVSADGKWGGGVLEDPKIGLVNLEDGTSQIFTGGCYANIAPDNSYRLWHFVGGHRAIKVFDFGGTSDKDKAKVRDVFIGEVGTQTVDPAEPKIKGFSFLHPKWSMNHARFMVMTGPFRNAESDGRTLFQNVELYLGRFNESFTEMEGWAQITSDLTCCYWPDAWIGSTAVPSGQMAPVAATPAAKPAAAWAAIGTGTAFVFEALHAPSNQAGGTDCSVVLHERAFYGLGGTLDLAGGSAEPDAASLRRVLDSATAAQALTVECTVIPAQVPSTGTIFRCGAVRLHQAGDQLLLDAGGASAPLGRLKAGVPLPVQLVLDAHTTARIDGAAVAGPLRPVTAFAAPLAFGGDGWAGELAGIHLAGAARRPEQLDAVLPALRARLAQRPKPAAITVQAVLRDVQTPPTEQMNSYRAALVGNLYEVQRVVAGTLKDKQIVVMQFAILDQQPVPRELRVGATYTLTLHAWDDRPEVHTTTLQEDNHPGLPQFLDPTR